MRHAFHLTIVALIAAALFGIDVSRGATTVSEPVAAPMPGSPIAVNDAQPAAAPVTDPARVQAIFRHVIAAPEYNQQAQTDLIARIRDLFVSWLQSLPDSFSAFKYAENLTRFTYLVMWAILLGAFVSVLYWGWKLIRLRVDEDDERAPKAVGQRFFSAPESYEPEIAKAVAAHSWPEAMTWSWRRFLAQLETRELVDADRTRTNWEYLRQLRRHAAAAKSELLLRDLAMAYDRHIYGRRPLSSEEWDDFETGLAKASAALELESGKGS